MKLGQKIQFEFNRGQLYGNKIFRGEGKIVSVDSVDGTNKPFYVVEYELNGKKKTTSIQPNQIISSAESGVLVGKSDINGRVGIDAIQPDGSPIRLGGGEIIMSEKASHDNCKKLSDMNVKAGGVAFNCEVQAKGNTDRASGKMPKDEYHQESAASGKSLQSDDNRTYYQEAHRYIENAKETLKKAGTTTDGRYYQDTKYVKSAAGIAYAGAEMAAKWFIKLRGIELKGKGIDGIKEAMSKIDKRILKTINSFYNSLHLNIYYGNETNKKIVDAAMESAAEMVSYLKPYKDIAHYASGTKAEPLENKINRLHADWIGATSRGDKAQADIFSKQIEDAKRTLVKETDARLAGMGWEYNKHNYRYGKKVDENTYITAFYNKQIRVFSIRGIKKFDTPLGGNSVSIAHDFSESRDFYDTINDICGYQHAESGMLTKQDVRSGIVIISKWLPDISLFFHAGIISVEDGVAYVYDNDPDNPLNADGGSVKKSTLKEYLSTKEVKQFYDSGVSSEEIQERVKKVWDKKFNWITFNCEAFIEEITKKKIKRKVIMPI